MRRLAAALRAAEQQADAVAEVLWPGPIGAPGVKWGREAQAEAEAAVAAAKRRWADAQPRDAIVVAPRKE